MSKKLVVLTFLFALSIPPQIQSVHAIGVRSYRELSNYKNRTVFLADATATAIDSSDEEKRIVKGGKDIIMYKGKIPIEVDYDRGVLIVEEKEIPIIVDGDVKILSRSEMAETTWVHLAYDRFDVYVDSAYYHNNTPAIDDFFNKFAPRFALLESITAWSSEKFYGTKLKIYVTSTAYYCAGGYAMPGETHLFLYENLSDSNVCKVPYYVNGSEHYGNPGELGDNWLSMQTALHEAVHTITPFPILARLWLAEGWAEYYCFNILSIYGDINQETANHGILEWSYEYSWGYYTTHDYKDYYGYEIQQSRGYGITAWMFSMLRDNYSLSWQNVYSILNNNLETLDKSWEIGGGSWYSIYTDTYVIDVFGKASSMNFSQIKNIFEYDPTGFTPPVGWGVRNWTDRKWYADLTPRLAVSDTHPRVVDGILLSATVYNTGAVSLDDVVVRFYSDTNLVSQQVVSVPESSFTLVSTKYTAPEGIYTMKVVANEDHIKIEKAYNNNEDSVMVHFLTYKYGDANGDGKRTVSDVIYLVNFIFQDGPPPNPLESGDANCDGYLRVSDIVYLVNYLFKGGPVPIC